MRVICHFGISIIWAALFAAIALRFPKIASRPLPTAVVFGLIVFFAMRPVVLPLSTYPRPVTFKALATALDLLSHMLLFGLPIVSLVGRAVRSRSSGAPESA